MRRFVVERLDAHLDIAAHVILDDCKGRVSEEIKEFDDAFCCFEEAVGVDSLVSDCYVGVGLSRVRVV